VRVCGSIFNRHNHLRLGAKPRKTPSKPWRELRNLFGLDDDKGPKTPALAFVLWIALGVAQIAACLAASNYG
jgi:hypothetical protein